MLDIKGIHEACYKAIGGEESDALKTYRQQKNSPLTRKEFFDRALWGILVAGFSRKGAETVKSRALNKCGFPESEKWKSLTKWDQGRFDQFASCMKDGGHGFHVSKWKAIRCLAERLYELGSDQAFQQEFFDGKATGDELAVEDLVRLRQFNLPWIKDATSQFVIRMLGAEVIKDDVHVQAFRKWRGWEYNDLNRAVVDAKIPGGEWDAVFWRYCEDQGLKGYEQHVAHFSREFARFFLP